MTKNKQSMTIHRRLVAQETRHVPFQKACSTFSGNAWLPMKDTNSILWVLEGLPNLIHSQTEASKIVVRSSITDIWRKHTVVPFNWLYDSIRQQQCWDFLICIKCCATLLLFSRTSSLPFALSKRSKLVLTSFIVNPQANQKPVL